MVVKHGPTQRLHRALICKAALALLGRGIISNAKTTADMPKPVQVAESDLQNRRILII